jgi:hypothetical protein
MSLEEYNSVETIEDERKKLTKKVKTFFGVTLSLFFVLWGLSGIVFRTIFLPDRSTDSYMRSGYGWSRFQAFYDGDAVIAGIHFVSYGVLLYSLCFTFPNNYAGPFWRRIWLTFISVLIFFITFVMICQIVDDFFISATFILIIGAVFTSILVSTIRREV